MTTIQPRSAWSARAPKAQYPLTDAKNGVVVHWLGVASGSLADEVARLQSAQRYHQVNKGWLDIAYHFAIGNSGAIYECRGFDVRGGATSGTAPDGVTWNRSSYAVVFLLQKGEKPSAEALSAFRNLMEEISAHTGMTSIMVTPHREASGSTECPGPDLMNLGGLWERPEEEPPAKPAPEYATKAYVQSVEDRLLRAEDSLSALVQAQENLLLDVGIALRQLADRIEAWNGGDLG